MRAAGIEGVRRSKRVRTTRAGPGACPASRPGRTRDFTADAPEPAVGHRPDVRADLGRGRLRLLHHRRLLADDRGLAGRLAHAHHDGPRRDRDGPLVTRHPARRAAVSLRCRPQFTSVRYGERLAEIGAVPSIGTVGDTFDNALAETVNGYYKAELIRGPDPTGPWKTVEDVELATLGWVHWHNTARLHGYLGDVPPAEFEQAFYAAQRTDQPRSKSNSPSLHQTQCGSRVVDYTIDDGRDNPEQYRLLTTILDPDQASATELASAYAQRWEIESVFDELKSHQRGPRAMLRSKSPQLVQQEMWGHLCCHYAIRTLMLDAATHAGHDPDRISFVAALRITRRSLSHSSFSPSQP